MNATEISKKLGMGSRFLVDNIRKAAKMEGKPLSKYSTAQDYRDWLKAHPTFVASRVARNLTSPSPRLGQQFRDAGKSDEPQTMSAQHTSSPSVG